MIMAVKIKIQRFKDKWSDTRTDLQEKLSQFWQNLQPRERLLLSITVGTTTFLLLLFFIKNTISVFYDQSTKAEKNYASYSKIQQLAEEMIKQKPLLLRYERLRAKRDENFNTTNFIQQQAANAGVTLTQISPTRPRGTKETENTEWFELKMGEGSTLPSALKLLQSIEEVLGMKVVEISVKPQFSDPTQLDVTAVIMNVKNL